MAESDLENWLHATLSCLGTKPPGLNVTAWQHSRIYNLHLQVCSQCRVYGSYLQGGERARQRGRLDAQCGGGYSGNCSGGGSVWEEELGAHCPLPAAGRAPCHPLLCSAPSTSSRKRHTWGIANSLLEVVK